MGLNLPPWRHKRAIPDGFRFPAIHRHRGCRHLTSCELVNSGVAVFVAEERRATVGSSRSRREGGKHPCQRGGAGSKQPGTSPIEMRESRRQLVGMASREVLTGPRRPRSTQTESTDGGRDSGRCATHHPRLRSVTAWCSGRCRIFVAGMNGG